MVAVERADSYGYDAEKSQEHFQRFDLEPVDPRTIAERFDADDSLEIADLPLTVGRQVVPEPETGTALYRLVQLFGTPNVPGVEAGVPDQRTRYRSTWTYLFRVTYDRRPDDDVPGEFLLAIYDYETDVSVGLAGWRDDGEGAVHEPVMADETDVPPRVPDEFASDIVKLALSVIEEPVPATYEDVWV